MLLFWVAAWPLLQVQGWQSRGFMEMQQKSVLSSGSCCKPALASVPCKTLRLGTFLPARAGHLGLDCQKVICDLLEVQPGMEDMCRVGVHRTEKVVANFSLLAVVVTFRRSL